MSSLESQSPIVRQIVLKAINSMRVAEILELKEGVIDTSLIPRVSESFRKSKKSPIETILLTPEETRINEEIDMKKIVEPIKRPQYKPSIITQSMKPAVAGQRMIKPVMKPQPVQTNKPAVPNEKFVLKFPPNAEKSFTGGYGKLDGLLRDPTISNIECPGPGQLLKVIRMGEKQSTRISLSPADTRRFLERVSHEARIPLVSGVFKVAVHNFIVNAIVSENVGTRFIIKKFTPYSMLENR